MSQYAFVKHHALPGEAIFGHSVKVKLTAHLTLMLSGGARFEAGDYRL